MLFHMQGTINPTHYIVLKNGYDLSVVAIQRLIYKLSFALQSVWHG